MSIRKDLVIKISNGSASLDMPLQIYEKDHGIELRFRLMDYKYKYDKDPDNILNSNKEDILEAYTTIINPSGYELTQINGEVVEDTVKFMIEDSYTDELEELGIYRLQIHVKCEHSEFSIPPVEFEVLERLKGTPLYAQVDEGVVDHSAASDEVEVIDIVDGKLQLVWQSGEIITSTRLNAMVDYANSLHDEINELEAPAVQVEGSVILCDSAEGYAQNVEILGNTIQNQNDLSDIRSVGDKVEGQELYKIDIINTMSTNENLFDIKDYKKGGCYIRNGFSPSDHCYYSDKFMNVKPNTTYYYFGRNGEYKPISYTVFYDENKNSIIEINDKTSVTSPSNARYMRISPWEDVIETDNPLDYVGEEEKYIQYQEDKLTILSPVQLEKVGDVADRIICKDGVWGVEKNIARGVIESVNSLVDDIEAFTGVTITLPNIQYQDRSNVIILEGFTTFIGNSVSKVPIYSIYCNTTNLVACFPKGTLLEDMRAHLIGRKYICISNQPTFIPLPYGQQIKLRTFAGKTNISFLTEIEGTIKAQIPQSIGATISAHTEQIDNLNKELDRVKKLEESAASTVATESNFTTVGATSNGYFDDVKLEGRTLVNLIKSYEMVKGNVNATNKGFNVTKTSGTIEYVAYNLHQPIKVGTDYTIIYTIKSNTITNSNSVYGLYADGFYGAFPSQTISGGRLDGKIGTFSARLQTNPNQTNANLLSIALHYADEGGYLEVDNIILLEGDHTQNPPRYFEGLKSVGEDVDELSVSSLNENLFDGELQRGYWYNGILNPNDNAVANVNNIHILQNTQYYISVENYSDAVYIAELDEKLNEIKSFTINNGSGFITSTVGTYLRLCTSTAINMPLTTKIQIVRSTIPKVYIEHRSNKKPLLYYNPTTQAWEKPVLREWDSIEKHSDGKYYYHKRSGEVVLNGSESWTASSTGYSSTLHFHASIIDKTGNDIIHNSGNDLVGITYYFGHSIIYKNEERVFSNVNDFKQWLQANPTTVVYKLKTEKVYECINIDLLTYENETNFMVNTGVITPKSTLKVMCNITNIVRELQQKVSNLENYIQHVMLDALNNALNE